MYTNPIILSDYSDPDAIRVGNVYYMTASSFNYTPGLPLLMSNDLVEWKLVGYAAKNLPFEHFDNPLQSKGIWAPSIRYHDGRFIITVGLPDEGIFVTESSDFTGDWSPLRCVWKGKGFIDPCPYWDSDGKAYIVHAYAKSRIGFKSRIGLLDADPKTLLCSGEDRFIFNGEETQPTIEGPKVYERNGFVYIMAPAGGVKCGWQTALRAKSIEGPFEERIVLHQGSSHINGPHQGAFIDSTDGKSWFLHFQDRGIYGRVTLLEPAGWKDDWPLMGTGVETGTWPGEPVDSFESPYSSETFAVAGTDAAECSDDFISGKPALQWQWQANHKENFVVPHDGDFLRLAALSLGKSKTIWDYPAVLTEKISSESFEAIFSLDAGGLERGGRSGVLFSGGQYASIGIEHGEDGKWKLFYLESENGADSESRLEVEKDSFPLPDDFCIADLSFSIIFRANPVNKVDADEGNADKTKPASGRCVFSAKCGNFAWKPDVDAYEPRGNHWTGGRIGMFTQSLCGNDGGYSDVKSVKVSSIYQKKE